MVTSASMAIAARDMGDPFYFLERQFIFTLAGVLFAWLVTRIPTEIWDKYGLGLLLLGLLLLTLVLIPGLGARVNGARRWLRIGVLNFQVSELAKVLVLPATWRAATRVRSAPSSRRRCLALMKPFGLLSVTAVLLLIGPDSAPHRPVRHRLRGACSFARLRRMAAAGIHCGCIPGRVPGADLALSFEAAADFSASLR